VQVREALNPLKDETGVCVVATESLEAVSHAMKFSNMVSALTKYLPSTSFADIELLKNRSFLALDALRVEILASALYARLRGGIMMFVARMAIFSELDFLSTRYRHINVRLPSITSKIVWW
jgi:hypothetical protein